MSLSVDVEELHEIVEGFTGGARSLHFRHTEHAPQLLLTQSLKVLVDHFIHGLLGLGVGEGGAVGVGLEPVLEGLAVPGDGVADPGVLPGVLPEGEWGGPDGELVAAFEDVSEGLLPLVHVEDAVLADVDGVEEVLDDRVRRHLLPRQLAQLDRQLAELLVRQLPQLALIKEAEGVVGRGHVEHHQLLHPGHLVLRPLLQPLIQIIHFELADELVPVDLAVGVAVDPGHELVDLSGGEAQVELPEGVPELHQRDIPILVLIELPEDVFEALGGRPDDLAELLEDVLLPLGAAGAVGEDGRPRPGRRRLQRPHRRVPLVPQIVEMRPEGELVQGLHARVLRQKTPQTLNLVPFEPVGGEGVDGLLEVVVVDGLAVALFEGQKELKR
mmetsp:Transcript_23065/g.22460  ORF Transcript_23065/g.22460 Transcript_23065/m.22460 type:complete len:385 (-) Transcript_23065:3826-4980(-)